MRHAIAYLSNAKPDLSEEEIANILKKAREYNNAHGITGLLLYRDGNFFELIEGEKTKIKELYATIKEDSRHQNIIHFLERAADQEPYDGFYSDHVTNEAKYDSEKLKNYIDHIEVMDPKAKNALEKVISLFLH